MHSAAGLYYIVFSRQSISDNCTSVSCIVVLEERRIQCVTHFFRKSDCYTNVFKIFNFKMFKQLKQRQLSVATLVRVSVWDYFVEHCHTEHFVGMTKHHNYLLVGATYV